MALAAALHFGLSTPNLLIQESFADFDVPWRDQLVRGAPAMHNGALHLSNRPGLGLELDEAAIAAHPYVPCSFPSLWPKRTIAKLQVENAAKQSLKRWIVFAERPSATETANGENDSPTPSTKPLILRQTHAKISRRLSRQFFEKMSRPYGNFRHFRPDGIHVEVSFLKEQMPRPGDADYWKKISIPCRSRPRPCATFEALVVLRPWVKRESLVAAAGRLLVIGRSGTGFDKIDVAACTEANIALFNVPSVLNHSTASAALLFMLALAKRLRQQQGILYDGRWDLQSSRRRDSGHTLGIVGLGNSGRELVRLVAPFEMKVLAYSPHAETEQAAALGVRLVSLDELCESADFISLHARLTPQSQGVIGREQISRMKPTAYLVNVARGELVDQQALVEALAERRIAARALDVFEHEPARRGRPAHAAGQRDSHASLVGFDNGRVAKPPPRPWPTEYCGPLAASCRTSSIAKSSSAPDFRRSSPRFCRKSVGARQSGQH